MGNTPGSPIITRLHNGQWAIIFGNGLGNNATAGIYVGLVNSSTGAVTFQFLDTGVGSSTSQDGIESLASVDLDGDSVTDYIYAGDIQGNVWRFDMTSSNPNNWTPTLLFVAKNPSGVIQPITSAPVIASVATNNVNRVIVLFGTGQKTPMTVTSPDIYASGVQSFYGIWDWNMTAWNSIANSNSQYAALPSAPTIDRTNLLQQTLTSSTTSTGGPILGYRSLSTVNTVCWAGTTGCTMGQYGWYFDLPASQEQIIYNPTLVGGAAVVNTAIPPIISASQCNPGLQSGWTMSFNVASGGGVPSGFFPGSNNQYGLSTSTSSVSGIQINAVGTPTTVTYNNQTYIITQTSSGSAAVSNVNPSNTASPQRVSWAELKN